MNRIIIISALLLSGCAEKPKAWLSIEKPPIRVILIDTDSDINVSTIRMLMREVKQYPYADVQFNPDISVNVNYNANFNYNKMIGASFE